MHDVSGASTTQINTAPPAQPGFDTLINTAPAGQPQAVLTEFLDGGDRRHRVTDWEVAFSEGRYQDVSWDTLEYLRANAVRRRNTPPLARPLPQA